MRKLITSINSVAIVGILLSGCAQPGVSTNSRHIEFINGKPHHIPINAKYSNIPVSSKIIKELKHFKKSNSKIGGNNGKKLSCKKGDILWLTEEGKRFLKLGKNKNNEVSLVISMYMGNAGCSSPLTKQQYKYVLQQQNINTNYSYSNNVAPNTYATGSSNTNSVRQYGGTNNYKSNGKTYNVKQHGSTDYYRSNGKTYNVRQYGGTNHYRVKEVGNKGPQWNNVGVQY